MNPILRPPSYLSVHHPAPSHWARLRRFPNPISNSESFVQHPDHCLTKETPLITTPRLLYMYDSWKDKVNFLFTYFYFLSKVSQDHVQVVCDLRVKTFREACEGASHTAQAAHRDRHSHRLAAEAGRQREARMWSHASPPRWEPAHLSLCILQTCGADPVPGLSLQREEYRTQASQNATLFQAV